MGQTQFKTLSLYGNYPWQPSPLGKFEKFASLPYELRVLIWEYALPGPRIIEVSHFRDKKGNEHWIPSSPPPTILDVNREARDIVLGRHTFHQKTWMKLCVNPAIDTLYFGPNGSAHFMSLLLSADEDDLKSLRNLAVHEMHLGVWNTVYNLPQITRRLFCIMDGLERLMIGVHIDSHGHLSPRQIHADNWTGWLYGGGFPTPAENQILSGTVKDLIFSTQSLDGHLFYFHADSSLKGDERYPEYLQLRSALPGHLYHNVFKHYYSNEPDNLGVRRGRGVLDNYRQWYHRVYTSLARIDFRAKRMLAFHQRMNPDVTENWTQLRVGAFVRPTGSFLSWEQCLQPLCDAQWPECQTLIQP
jgi:hypothetical protein